MTQEEIAATVKAIELIQMRLENLTEIRKRHTTLVLSRDYHRELAALGKRLNLLLDKLDAANVEHRYAHVTVEEEKPQPMPVLLQLFVEDGLDLRDLAPDPPPRNKSLVSDGLGPLVGW